MEYNVYIINDYYRKLIIYILLKLYNYIIDMKRLKNIFNSWKNCLYNTPVIVGK